MLRLVDLIVSKGVGLTAIVKVIVHLMPSFLVLTIPIACLIASIAAFSRLSYDNELLAMRATGLSLWRIAMPVLLFSSLTFALTVYLSQWGQPWSNISLKKIALKMLEDQLNLALEAGVFNEPIPGLMVYVPHPRDGQEATGLFISDHRDADTPLVIVAKSYQVLKDPARKRLGLRLHNGTIHQIPRDIQQYHQVGFTTYDLWLEIPASQRIGTIARPSYAEIIQQLEKTGWQDRGALRRLMEYYKDWGFPVASLLLGLLGVPVGIVSKRSGRVGGFAIGVMIIVGFYLMNVLGEYLVTSYFLHPFVGAWLPDAVILGVTGWLFVRASQQ